MLRFPIAAHRLAALSIALTLAVTLGACSRKDKILNPVVSGTVTWTNTVRHLIADRSEGTAPTGCTSCHHQGTTISDWTLYANVYANRALVKTDLQVNGSMRRFLRPGEPEVVIAWIDANAPE